MFPGDLAKRPIFFRRVDREQLDSHRTIEIENSDDVAIVDFDDTSEKRGCCGVDRNKSEEQKSDDEIARHNSPGLELVRSRTLSPVSTRLCATRNVRSEEHTSELQS